MKQTFFIAYDDLQKIIDELLSRQIECIGPQVSDGAIVYKAMNTIALLPWGVRDIQGKGSYKLSEVDNSQAFAWANGPAAVKPIVFKPEQTVFTVAKDANGKLQFNSQPKARPKALIGIRPCDLHALTIQDKVFLHGDVVDPFYKVQRQALWLIVVNCSYSSDNCFCLTADGHPKADKGFDIALTEISKGFVAEFGSGKARDLQVKFNFKVASQSQLKQAQKKIDAAVNGQTKKLVQFDPQYLIEQDKNPHWDDVAKRCLSCGNCTQVCPTCFCHRQVEKPALTGNESQHVRQWDSCFTQDHSYIHGMTIRASTKQRYRQWLTHKLGSWHQQFGTSGCVGCGRCISWCPTGIDITEEVNAVVTTNAAESPS